MALGQDHQMPYSLQPQKHMEYTIGMNLVRGHMPLEKQFVGVFLGKNVSGAFGRGKPNFGPCGMVAWLGFLFRSATHFAV